VRGEERTERAWNIELGTLAFFLSGSFFFFLGKIVRELSGR